MNSPLPRCSICQAEVPIHAPGASCPACLLGLGLADAGFVPDARPGSDSGRNRRGESAAVPPSDFSERYEILNKHREGGMGIVYRARQPKLDRIVCIKMMRPELLLDGEAVTQFYDEARAAAQLHHPNIVEIYEVDEHAGRHFFAMEFVEGQNLAELTNGKPLHPVRAAAYVETIATAIHHAHQKGIVHCDLKPQNILIGLDDQPKVTDFGLARFIDRLSATDDGRVRGTPSYMSPEQAAGGRQGLLAPTDIYALGAILYELLTGRRPFEAPSREATIWAIKEAPVQPLRKFNPAVPLELEAVCLKCLEKSPAQRYASAQALAEALIVWRGSRAEPGLSREVKGMMRKIDALEAGLRDTMNKSVRESLLRWAVECGKLCREEDDHSAGDVIEKSVSEYAAGKFRLCLVGMAKQGKSTLINALLRRKDDLLAPRGKLPTTSMATIFQWGETDKVIVSFLDGTTREVPVEAISSYVTEDENPANVKGVKEMNVSGPYEILRRIILIDLPGLGSLHEHHNQTLFQYFPQSDAVLLLTSARMPINADELDLIRTVRKEDVAKLFVAINRIDECEAEEIAQCEAHDRKELNSIGITSPKIYKFSALQAFKGDLEKSGLLEFTGELDQFLARESGRIMAEKLRDEVLAAATPPLQALAARVAAAGKTAQEIAEERAHLAREREAALRAGKSDEQAFIKTWDRAISEAHLLLPGARDRMRARLAKEVENGSLAQLGSLAKKLPTRFNQILQDEAGASLAAMEERLAQACRALEASYPTVDILGGGMPRIVKPKEGNAALTKGVLAGGAAVAGGVAVASAAQAALAAAAVTTTVVAPAAATAASIAGIFSTGLASFITGLGTSTVAAAAPSALLVAAGPIGLTLAGVGALAIPLAWRLTQKRKKEEIAEQIDQQVLAVFRSLMEERLPALKSFGPQILAEFAASFERRIRAIDDGLARVAARADQAHDNTAERERFERLTSLLARPPATAPERA